ncbi:hypothetical protein KAU32_10710 [bacterium]|nr:hypothetical protein [bacterium]
MHVFIHGPKGSGKSSAVRGAIKLLTRPIGGLITEKLDGMGISIQNIMTGEKIHFNVDDPPRQIASIFNSFGVEAFIDTEEDQRLLIIDELGFLESKAELFTQAVTNFLQTSLPLIAVLQDYRPNLFWDMFSGMGEKVLMLDASKISGEEIIQAIMEQV